MKKSHILMFINVLLFFVFLSVLITGLLITYKLPHGGGGGKFVLWGLDRHEWGDLHFYLSLGLSGIILVHLLMHIRYLVAVFSNGITKYGRAVNLLIAIIAIVITIASVLLFTATPERLSPQFQKQGMLRD